MIATVFTIFACAGCGRSETPATGSLALEPDGRWHDDRFTIVTPIRFRPSPAMREALGSGVDLRLDVITRVERRIGPFRWPHEKSVQPIGIRFLPLTEQWVLTIDETQRSFPRLWLLLDALAQPHLFETGLTRRQLERGRWQVRTRARFNREDLPPPMHLPALFSPQWRLAGRWHAWRPARS